MLESISGYKTYLGGVGFILWGVSDIFLSIYNNKPADWNIVIGKFITGWTIIGGRSAIGKIE